MKDLIKKAETEAGENLVEVVRQIRDLLTEEPSSSPIANLLTGTTSGMLPHRAEQLRQHRAESAARVAAGNRRAVEWFQKRRREDAVRLLRRYGVTAVTAAVLVKKLEKEIST